MPQVQDRFHDVLTWWLAYYHILYHACLPPSQPIPKRRWKWTALYGHSICWLDQGQHWLMRWILLWIISHAHDRSLDMLTWWVVCFNYATTASHSHSLFTKEDRNKWCFRPWFCIVNLCWAGDIVWSMPLLQDQLLDMLSWGLAYYHVHDFFLPSPSLLKRRWKWMVF